MTRYPLVVSVAFGLTMLGASAGRSANNCDGTPTYQILREDVIINADIWDEEPKMLAAGLGFTYIIGVSSLDANDPQLSEFLVRQAGGTWNTVTCQNDVIPTLNAFTSAQTPFAVA